MKKKRSPCEIVVLVLRATWIALTVISAYGLYFTCSYIYGTGDSAAFALVPDIIENTLAGIAVAMAAGAVTQYAIRSNKER